MQNKNKERRGLAKAPFSCLSVRLVQIFMDDLLDNDAVYPSPAFFPGAGLCLKRGIAFYQNRVIINGG